MKNPENRTRTNNRRPPSRLSPRPPAERHRRPERASPILRFTPTAWAKLLFFCHRGQTEIFRVVSDHEPVEGTQQSRANARTRGDLLAFGEAVGFVRPEPGTEQARVCGIGGVHVRVAPEHPVGIVVVQVGGVLFLGRSYGAWIARILREHVGHTDKQHQACDDE